MNHEELIRELRNSKGWPNLGNAAADRIEQLVNDNHRWKMECEEFWRKREDAAEAKLAKALEAIRQMMEDAEYPDAVWETGTAFLAELEGK
jgi:hypothetical protein